MSGIAKLEDRIKKLQEINKNKDEIVLDILEKYRHIVLDMNTEDQLYMKGVDSDNVPIINREPYTPFTIKIKTTKGQPTNRVTLRDGGDFHNNFTLKRSKGKINITSTDQKTEELEFRYGDSIFGLIDENKKELAEEYIKPELLKMIKE